MTSPLPPLGVFGADREQTRLRATMATLERRIACAFDAGLDDGLGRRLQASFVALSGQLGVSASTQTRCCPVCKRSALKRRICPTCWSELGALAAVDPR